MIQEMSAIGVAAIGAIGAIIGAGVSAIVILLNGWRQRKHEKMLAEKRNDIQVREKIRDTALNIALKEWDFHINHVKTFGGSIYPSYAYIFLYHKILTLMEEGQLSPENLVKAQKEMIKTTEQSQAMYDHYRNQNT